MANNRLYIVDEDSGDRFLLAKGFGSGWNVPPGLEGTLDEWLRDREIGPSCSGATQLRLATEDELHAARGADDCADAICAGAQVADWWPIETAPRGVDCHFLGWDGKMQLIDRTWEGWEDDGKPVYVHADYIQWKPTHWMPLPAPPKAEKG